MNYHYKLMVIILLLTAIGGQYVDYDYYSNGPENHPISEYDYGMKNIELFKKISNNFY